MSGNRLPNNGDESGSEHVYITEENGALCMSCRFVEKCHKYKTIVGFLAQLEQYAFENWTIDIDTMAMLTYCPTYVMSPVADMMDEDE